MKRTQIKIQETAFMLLALVLLFVILFMFYSNIQVKQIYSEVNKIKEESAISMLQKLSAMPEFAAIEGGIDYDKLLALRNVSGYNALWQGIDSIKVVKIFPRNESKTIVVYSALGSGNVISYSIYMPLCVTRKTREYIWQDCDLARIIVSVEEIKQARR